MNVLAIERLAILQKEIAKAYKTLTDEEAKENWKKYGNPDGPGGNVRTFFRTVL